MAHVVAKREPRMVLARNIQHRREADNGVMGRGLQTRPQITHRRLNWG
jgi:hypothetical protein